MYDANSFISMYYVCIMHIPYMSLYVQYMDNVNKCLDSNRLLVMLDHVCLQVVVWLDKTKETCSKCLTRN